MHFDHNNSLTVTLKNLHHISIGEDSLSIDDLNGQVTINFDDPELFHAMLVSVFGKFAEMTKDWDNRPRWSRNARVYAEDYKKPVSVPLNYTKFSDSTN
jgi:hypothetical protein